MMHYFGTTRVSTEQSEQSVREPLLTLTLDGGERSAWATASLGNSP
jgi:hypothetical protein